MPLKQSNALKHTDTSGTLSVSTLVPLLFGARGPTAILWRVGTIVVDAVNGVIGRWLSAHVRQKCLVVRPSVANRNSTPAIARIPAISWILATLEHVRPRLVFSRPPSAPGFAMRGLSDGAFFAVIAATTYRLPAMQPCGHKHPLGSAVASTQDVSSGSPSNRFAHYHPTPKTLPNLQMQRARFGTFTSAFASRASTATNASALRPQLSATGNSAPSAVALAQPMSAWSRIVNRAKNQKPIKALSGQV